MSNKTLHILIIVILLVSFSVALYLYPLLPERIASHWNAAGEVDGYMSKLWGLMLLPIILLGVSVLFLVLPLIDPLRENIKLFRRQYNAVIALIILFLTFVYTLTIIWNVGVRFPMERFIVPGIGLLFVFIGFILPKVGRNWFMGIRTPWTLSSDLVWEKTHKLGGVVFVICGIITVVGGALWPTKMILVVVTPLLLGGVVTMVYSYLLYRKGDFKP